MASIKHSVTATGANSAARQVSVDAWNHDHIVSGLPQTATTRSAMAALATTDPAYLTESGREGVFVFDGSNLSTQVTADTQQGIYVAPSSDSTGASGAWVRKDDHPNVKWFGAKGDGSTDDTTAIQAMVNYLGYLRLPAGTFKITDSITVPAATALGTMWAGEGMEKSIISCSGMTGKAAIKPANASAYYRVAMRDFQVTGDCDSCFDWTLTSPYELYESEFRNLVLSSSAGSCFKANLHFSTAWYNVHVSSTSGHGFDLGGGNSTVLVNCYAHQMGGGKAGYRIKTIATLIACNGVDTGDLWGHFGGTTADDGANSVFKATLIGCNIEAFAVSAIKLAFTGTITLCGCSLTKTSGTYTTILDGTTASTLKIIEQNCTPSLTATMTGASRIITTNLLADIQSNSLFTDFYDTGVSLVYPVPVQSVSGPAFQIAAKKFTNLDFDRAWGFALQAPVTWTANSATFSVAGISRVKTANTAATNFTNATGGTDGQELVLLIKDANTTIKHLAGSSGQFQLTGAANLTPASGTNVRFILNGSNWVQS
jgi:hypothetical protein